MNKNLFFAVLLSLAAGLGSGAARAQEAQAKPQAQQQSQTQPKSSQLQQRAEAEQEKGNVAGARFNFIRAYEDYAQRGELRQAVECATRATALYYRENYYKEAFELLRRAEQTIYAARKTDAESSALRYLTTRERLQMYIKLRKSDSAKEQMRAMEALAAAAHDETVANDLLYNKAVYYYTFGYNAQGNAVFREMADKLTAQKEYGKVDEVYQTLIANARKSGNAALLAQSYSGYLAWKDSASAMKLRDETGALKQQIADNEAVIARQDSSLGTRRAVIVGLCILAAALAAALVLGAVVLLRYIVVTRKQKKTIRLANENNALKAKFISNISAQLDPTLRKLDASLPEVKALTDFSAHIQTLSKLENTPDDEPLELEETQIPKFCEDIAAQIRPLLKEGVTFNVNAPRMSAPLHREYVAHILLHLLRNAAEYTPAGGTVWLDYKKRGAHTHEFLVSDTGCGIADDQRDEVFKPFREIRDLTTGDGLGLPICKQMALKMNGDLDIDTAFTRGTRFVLNLHA